MKVALLTVAAVAVCVLVFFIVVHIVKNINILIRTNKLSKRHHKFYVTYHNRIIRSQQQHRNLRISEFIGRKRLRGIFFILFNFKGTDELKEAEYRLHELESIILSHDEKVDEQYENDFARYMKIINSFPEDIKELHINHLFDHHYGSLKPMSKYIGLIKNFIKLRETAVNITNSDVKDKTTYYVNYIFDLLKKSDIDATYTYMDYALKYLKNNDIVLENHIEV